MASFDENSLLCAKCVPAVRFARWVQKNGERGQCDFKPKHGNRGHVVTVERFSEFVDTYFRERYQLGENEPRFTRDDDKPYYTQRGDDLTEILANDLRAEDNGLVEAVIDLLSSVSHFEMQDGGDGFYDSTSSYESIDEVRVRQRADSEEYWYQERFSYQWEEFSEKVQYVSRFFGIREALRKLFGKPSEYVTGGKVDPIHMLPAGQRIFRGRTFGSGFKEADFGGKNAASSLGAPPREAATAGRMNVEFIPAFYGAFSEATVIAELRPGIGDRIAIGEFEFQRPMKVFDFTVFSNLPHSEWLDSYRHTRYDFITQMEQQISRPALSHDKQRHYIPTQIVAEYLGRYFECEAVIYKSAMIRGKGADARNIVILPRQDGFSEFPGSILAFKGYEIKGVDDVAYTVSKDMF